MNRAEKAKALFLENVGRRVTYRMLREAGVPSHTARNASAEAKKIMPGYLIRHENAPDGNFMESGWVCVKIEERQLEIAV